jgi:hypothetical protein
MDENLTIEQAYEVMFEFIKGYYYRLGEPDLLGLLLGGFRFLESEKSADPAAWEDWLEAVKKVRQFKIT